MNKRPVSKTERLAEASRILGILSVGLAIIPFPISFLLSRFPGWNTDDGAFYSVGFLLAFIFLGSIIFGISGGITALVALGKTIGKVGDNRTKKMATISLILSGLGLSAVPLLLIYIRFFR